MIRFLIRLIGFLILAAAFVALVIDGTRSIAAQTLTLTSTEQSWRQLSPETLSQTLTFVEALGVPMLSDPILSSILAAPTFAPLAVLGILLMLIGGRPRRKVGVTP